jgi:hypothetical protein
MIVFGAAIVAVSAVAARLQAAALRPQVTAPAPETALVR